MITPQVWNVANLVDNVRRQHARARERERGAHKRAQARRAVELQRRRALSASAGNQAEQTRQAEAVVTVGVSDEDLVNLRDGEERESMMREYDARVRAQIE